MPRRASAAEVLGFLGSGRVRGRAVVTVDA
jgi:hypothetical protein